MLGPLLDDTASAVANGIGISMVLLHPDQRQGCLAREHLGVRPQGYDPESLDRMHEKL